MSDSYAKLINPKWKDYRPELPAGIPEHDAALLDMIENLLVEGKIEIKRTFLPSGYWQISYVTEYPSAFMSGGGASVRGALASLAVSMAENRLRSE